VGELMAGKGKKIAAALAAVSLYLQEEEAMAQEQQNIPVDQRVPGFSQWGQSGRQDMMTMRRLVQLRTFTRF
jgi:hypothetical protein